ncbi:MAG: type VI secretion protein IcmF/TssM N-terminal domain-containing protein [Thermoanaerobaculia bacterium]
MSDLSALNQLFQTLLRDYLGVLLAVLAVLIGAVVWWLYRLAQEARPDSETDDSRLRPEASVEAVDLTTPPPRPDLRKSFARARAALRRVFRRGRADYERPWVLVLGPALSGKTTLLGRSRLGLPFGQPRQRTEPDHPGINWWAFNAGIVLDVVGKDLLRTDGLSSDDTEWKTILRLIRRSRPRRPIDSAVLTLPAYTLLSDKKPLEQSLAEASRRGALLQHKLAQAQRDLGMRLPVYLLVSHCDLIPGFPSLVPAAVAGSDRRQQLVGWSNPSSPKMPYSGGWVEQAFVQIRDEIEGFQLEALASGSAGESDRGEDSVRLPQRLAELSQPLTIYANHLFSPSAGLEPMLFRGLYFCGGGTGPGDRAAVAAAGTDEAAPSEVVFVGDLLDDKVFPETGLGQPTERASTRASRWRAALAGLTIAALAWVAFGATREADRVRAVAEGQKAFVELALGLTEPVSVATPTGEDRARGFLASASDVEAFRLRSLGLPASLFSGLPKRRNRAVETGFEEDIFPPILSSLGNRARDLELVSPAARTPEWADELVAIEDYPEFRGLDSWTRELSSLDRSVAAYQRFAGDRIAADDEPSATGDDPNTEDKGSEAGADKSNTGSADDKTQTDDSSSGSGIIGGLVDGLSKDISSLLAWLEGIPGYLIDLLSRIFPARTAASERVEELNTLTRPTLQSSLRPKGGDPEDFYGQRLGAVASVEFEHDPHRAPMRKSVDALADSFLEAIFDRNPLRLDLDLVAEQWRRLDLGYQPTGSELDEYRALRKNLEEIQKALEAKDSMAEPTESELDEYRALRKNLEEIQKALEAKDPMARPTESELDEYRALRKSLEETQKALEAEDSMVIQWSAADVPDLGDGFDEILRRIHDSPFLGPEVADVIRRKTRTRFLAFQNRLESTRGDDDVLLARSDQKWTLSPEAEEVLASLEEILGVSFVEDRCQPSREARAWDTAKLEKAHDLYLAYLDWDGVEELPPLLADSAPEVALEGLERNMICLISEGQPYAFPEAPADPGQLEDTIGLQIANLQAAEKTLVSLLDALGDLGLSADRAALAGTIRNQRTHIFTQLTTLLEALDLYASLDGSFAWWQGLPGPGLEAFGAKTADQLDDYLKTTRETVTRLSSAYAEPLQATFSGSSAPGSDSWDDIVSDLADYAAKTPGNPLASLEDFVSTIAINEPPKKKKKDDDNGDDADATDAPRPDVFDLMACFASSGAENCSACSMPAAVASGGDYFLNKRAKLRNDLLRRCGELADEGGYEQYMKLGRLFNQRLAGRFPFASEHALEDATPADIGSFFDGDTKADRRPFSETRLLLDNLPECSRQFGDSRDRALGFMKEMVAARKLFRSFLAPEAKTENPVFDVRVRFRIDRTKEQGANQIIDWLMSVGEPAEKGERSENGEKVIDLLNTRSVSPAPDAKDPQDPDGRWLYGKPVTLTFRWATGSLFSPNAPADSVHGLADGRTLTYRYREPWSLLRLLVEYRVEVEHFPLLTESNPITTEFSIDTVEEGAEEPRTAARVYLAINLLPPDGGKPLELPDFRRSDAPLTDQPPAPAKCAIESAPEDSQPAAKEARPAAAEAR